MTTTTNRAYPLPAAANNVSDDVLVLIAAITAIDADIGAALTSIAGKAATGHTHLISAVTGLTEALAALAAIDHTHALASLSDVDTAGISIGYLIKWSGTGWVPTSAAAALGTHGHTIAQITDLTATLSGKLAAASNLSDVASVTTARANLKIVTIAQAAYDALSPPDADTIYFVTG